MQQPSLRCRVMYKLNYLQPVSPSLVTSYLKTIPSSSIRYRTGKLGRPLGRNPSIVMDHPLDILLHPDLPSRLLQLCLQRRLGSKRDFRLERLEQVRLALRASTDNLEELREIEGRECGRCGRCFRFRGHCRRRGDGRSHPIAQGERIGGHWHTRLWFGGLDDSSFARDPARLDQTLYIMPAVCGKDGIFRLVSLFRVRRYPVERINGVQRSVWVMSDDSL